MHKLPIPVKAREIMEHALAMKANAGGAIKDEIRDALSILRQYFKELTALDAEILKLATRDSDHQ